MKNKHLLTALLLLSVFVLGAQNIATFDKITRNWTVRTKNYSCVFFYGHMFPVQFALASGELMPRSSFQDVIRNPQTKELFYLNLDRRAEIKVLTNNAKEFVAETTGQFCRVKRPHMIAFENVKAVYRWHFFADKPGFKVSCRLEKPEALKVTVVQTIAPVWEACLGDTLTLLADGKVEKMQPGKFYDRRKGVVLSGEKFSVRVIAKRIISIIDPKSRYKTRINAGHWGFDWKNNMTAVEAEITLSGK